MMKSKLMIAFAAVLTAGSLQAQMPSVEVTADIIADTLWTRDTVWVLRDAIYVLPPAVLTIEPGTVVRGITDAFADPANLEPGALIVARGAKIIANGTPDMPIYFTSRDDPYTTGGTASIPALIDGVANTPRIYAPDGPGLPFADNGFNKDREWGGLVVLGEGPIGYDGDDPASLTYNPVTNMFTDTEGEFPKYPSGAYAGVGADMKGGNGVGIALIEGAALVTLPITPGGYTEPFPGATNVPALNTVLAGVYGGLDRTDNNGVLRFVTSRYGGFTLGSDNELNGITFGATGTGFDCDWCDSYNNADDGFEFFGGYGQFKYLFSLYQGDDGFDGDQGFNGTLQHILNITDNSNPARSGYAMNNTATGRIAANDGDNGAEWDGSEGSVQDGSVTPNTDQYVYNFSIIPGRAAGSDGALIRRGVAGEWNNGSMQDIVDDGFTDTAPTTATGNRIVLSNLGGTAQSGVTMTLTNVTLTGATDVYVKADHTTMFGLDPRLSSATIAPAAASFPDPADRTDAYPYTGWTPAPFAGCMRDSTMMAHTILADLAVLDLSGQPDRPGCAIDLNGSDNPTVTWTVDTGIGGRAILYSVERSSDQKTWVCIGSVADGNAGNADVLAAAYQLTDSAAAGTITVTDTGVTVTADADPVYYRVIPL